MHNQTVEQFYQKVGVEGYVECYRLDHSPRIAAIIEKYGLKEGLKGKRLVDIGGGLGFAGELLDKSTEYVVIDGAEIEEAQKLCNGQWFTQDLDYDHFSSYRDTVLGGEFDAAFFLETIEHLISPYHCIAEIKKIVKPDGDIFVSTPTEQVTHNTPYPSLFWPYQNFIQWLGQMALPVVDAYVYQPEGRGWPAYQYRCRNADWKEAKMLFPKDDPKFVGKTAQEYSNL
jgi:2-polyprenyl-3-methyl-5-hydroxy-6-metoxy-1,4-benzoquinol methylase